MHHKKIFQNNYTNHPNILYFFTELDIINTYKQFLLLTLKSFNSIIIHIDNGLRDF